MSHPSGPPPEQRIRDAAPSFRAGGRDTTPAVGRRGEPGVWRRAVEGGRVALFRERWGDERWSFLFQGDTAYAPEPHGVAVPPGAAAPPGEAARRALGGPDVTVPVQGPVIKPPVWTWEVPLYFWFGGIAAGSSFIALAAEAVADEHAARVARFVSLGAIGPGGVLLIADLGRPARFLHMLRIFKPRSPMSMGAWCLSAFGGTLSGAIGADLLGRERERRALTAATAFLGSYLGSYTGVLLASTAVPVWARSRLFLGPIFISTALAKSAAANRLALAALGTPHDDPTRRALGAIETGAIVAEIALSTVNERRLGELRHPLESGRAGTYFRLAKAAIGAGLAARVLGRRRDARLQHVSSVLYLAGGMAFRFGWVQAGRQSAHDDEAVARAARGPERP